MVSGQMDIVVSVPMVESFLHDFRWSGMSRYLAADKIMWKDEEGEVAGYVTEVKNLTRVRAKVKITMVKGLRRNKILRLCPI